MKDPVDLRKLYLCGFAALVVGVTVILLLFSGAPQIDAGDTFYNNGVLKTPLIYGNDEPLDVWIQYDVTKSGDMLSYDKYYPVQSYTLTLNKGVTVSEMPVYLSPGKYKIFIYILDRTENHRRITGFIKYVEV